MINITNAQVHHEWAIMTNELGHNTNGLGSQQPKPDQTIYGLDKDLLFTDRDP